MFTMQSPFQTLPLEIIDMIIGHAAKPSKKWDVHNCQYRKCVGKVYQKHNVDLLNLSQVCQLFRQRVLPKVWSTVLVRRDNYRSFNNFIYSTPNRETVYLQYVKYLIFEPVSKGWAPIRDDWFYRDEKEPFGIALRGSSYPAWFFKQTIFSMQYRNVERMDIINSGGIANHSFYELRAQFIDLFPFWLSASKGSSRLTYGVDFAILRAALTDANKNDPKDGIKNKLKALSEKDFKPIQKYRHLNPSRSEHGCRSFAWAAEKFVKDEYLLNQVQSLCKNDWKPLKDNSVPEPKYNRRSSDGCVHM